MQNELDEDLNINFKKIFSMLWYRRKLIIKTFVIVLLVFLALTCVWPKKYKTDADLYINKSNNTNLMELNPYILSSLSGTDGLTSLMSGIGGDLQNEIEIMKSPLVMDNVIKENDIRYDKGKKKGELVTTKDFLKKNISVKQQKGTNVVKISYKSKKALSSYNVVNSIINNYERVNEDINTAKAVKDKKLLEASYADTSKILNEKLSAMKTKSGLPDNALTGLGMLAAIKGHHKAIGGAMSSIRSQVVEGKKSEIDIQQDVDKLSLVKSKLEWTKLVEQLSKDTTNVIVLKQPEIKRSFEHSIPSPKLWVNLLLGAILGFIASVIAVTWAEITDKKLTYSELGDNVIYNIEIDKEIADIEEK